MNSLRYSGVELFFFRRRITSVLDRDSILHDYTVKQLHDSTIQQQKNYHSIRARGLTVWSAKSFFRYL